MRLLFMSAMYALPAESTATPLGLFNFALAAAPSSTLKTISPIPATVVTTPFETLRIRWLPVSAMAMYRLPAEFTARPYI